MRIAYPSEGAPGRRVTVKPVSVIPRGANAFFSTGFATVETQLATLGLRMARTSAAAVPASLTMVTSLDISAAPLVKVGLVALYTCDFTGSGAPRQRARAAAESFEALSALSLGSASAVVCACGVHPRGRSVARRLIDCATCAGEGAE